MAAAVNRDEDGQFSSRGVHWVGCTVAYRSGLLKARARVKEGRVHHGIRYWSYSFAFAFRGECRWHQDSFHDNWHRPEDRHPGAWLDLRRNDLDRTSARARETISRRYLGSAWPWQKRFTERRQLLHGSL